VEAVARIDQTIAEIDAIVDSIEAAVKQQDAATAEIARTVVVTAKAANEITNRTTDASSAATATGRSAAGLRDSPAALNLAVDGLRQSVMQVVRESTASVDRRQFQRHVVDLGGDLMLDGRDACRVRISDLSERGACLQGAPEAAVDTKGSLRLDGV